MIIDQNPKIIGLCVAQDLFLTANQRAKLISVSKGSSRYIDTFLKRVKLTGNTSLTDAEMFSLTGVDNSLEDAYTLLITPDGFKEYSDIYGSFNFEAYLRLVLTRTGAYERYLFLSKYQSPTGDYSDEIGIPAFDLNSIIETLKPFPLKSINKLNLHILRKEPMTQSTFFDIMYKILHE